MRKACSVHLADANSWSEEEPEGFSAFTWKLKTRPIHCRGWGLTDETVDPTSEVFKSMHVHVVTAPIPAAQILSGASL